MEEKFDVLNEFGEFTGEIVSREECHKKGLWHRAVYGFIIDENKNILLQKRSAKKKLWPNLWDVTAGGHVNAGEFGRQALIREVKEELGIESNNIEFVKKYKEELNNNGVDSKEIVSLFIMYLDEEERKFKLQKEEVSDIKWFTKIEIEKLIKDKKIIPHIEVYNLLRNILK